MRIRINAVRRFKNCTGISIKGARLSDISSVETQERQRWSNIMVGSLVDFVSFIRFGAVFLSKVNDCIYLDVTVR